MSFDVLIVKRNENTTCVRYEIGSNCAPSSPIRRDGDTISAGESFNHVDGVTLYEDDMGVWVYNVERDCLALFDSEEGMFYSWDDPDEYDQAYEPFNRLRSLFRDHWPSLGEIADAIAPFVEWKNT